MKPQGLDILLGEMQQCICVFCDSYFLARYGTLIQYKYLNTVYFDYKTKLNLIVSGRQGKYIFVQKGFYLPSILNNINEQDKSFLDCKHRHMKSGAPPDKSPVPSVTSRIPWFQKQN